MESHSSAVIGHWPVLQAGSPPTQWVVTPTRMKQLSGLLEGVLLLVLGLFCGLSLRDLLSGDHWSNLGFVLTALATQMLVIALPLLLPVRMHTFPQFQGISRERLVADAGSILLSLLTVQCLGLPFAPVLPLILVAVRLLVSCFRWELIDLSTHLHHSAPARDENHPPNSSPVPGTSRTLGLVIAGGIMALTLSWKGGFATWPDGLPIRLAEACLAGLTLLRPGVMAFQHRDIDTRPDWPNTMRAGLVTHLMAFAGIVATHCYSIFLGVPFDLGTYVLLAGLAGMALDWGDCLARFNTSTAASPVTRPATLRIPWLRIYNASLGLVVYAGMAWFVMHLLPVQSYRN